MLEVERKAREVEEANERIAQLERETNERIAQLSGRPTSELRSWSKH